MVSEIYKIKLGDFDIKHCNKVLKAKDYISVVDSLDVLSSTKSECSKILRKANEDRDKIIADANDEAKKIGEQANISKQNEEKKGYEEGLERGKQEIANTMMDFVAKSSASFSKLEKDITGVVKSSVSKIVGKIDKDELIVNVVKNSLQRIKMQKHATIKVAPSEAPILRDRIAELTKDSPMLEFLDICSDAHLSSGSCIIETELGVIDASVPVQLEAIQSALSTDTSMTTNK